MPRMDILNALVASVFQLCLGIIPWYMFLRKWSQALLWLGICLTTVVVLYHTWYKNLPSPEET